MLLVGLGLAVGVDSGARRARLEASDPWVEPLFSAAGQVDPEIGSRILTRDSALRLPGFPAGAQLTLALRLSTARRQPFDVTVWINDRRAGAGRLRGSPGTLTARGVADERGELRLRLSSRDGVPAAHLYGLEAVWRPQRLATLRAPFACLVVLLLAGLLGTWACESLAGAMACGGAASLALAWALGGARLALLAQLPRLALCLGAGLALLLASLTARWPRAWARWFAVALALRLWLATQAAFPCIDCSFHHHRFRDFQRSRLLTSSAPGPSPTGLVVPYPPALYATLQPVYRLAGAEAGKGVVRGAILFLEAAAPLLLAALLLAGGASREAAAAAAAALACLPEGLLVAAKGIAPNVFGGSVTLLALWAFARPGTSVAVLAAVLAVGLLSHMGAALTLGACVLLWLARAARHDPRFAWRGLLALLAAAAVAWLVYYREVAQVLSSATQAAFDSAAATGPAGWGLRGVRVGKTLQDLLLKFGAAPLALAWLGWRRRSLPPQLQRAATSCLAVGALAGLAAWLTPFPLRFEYFVLPTVALLAGVGAEECARSGRRGWAEAALALALGVQAVLGVALVEGWFDPINVIMESPRWPLRDLLLGGAAQAP